MERDQKRQDFLGNKIILLKWKSVLLILEESVNNPQGIRRKSAGQKIREVVYSGSQLSDFLRKNPPSDSPGQGNTGSDFQKGIDNEQNWGGEGKIKFGILFWQNTYQVQSMERDQKRQDFLGNKIILLKWKSVLLILEESVNNPQGIRRKSAGQKIREVVYSGSQLSDFLRNTSILFNSSTHSWRYI